MSKRLNHTDRGRERHHHYSCKMQTHFLLDSKNEKDIALVMEFDAGVTRYIAQPFSTIYAGLDGKKRRYTTDFLCEKNGQNLRAIEVKLEKHTKSPDFEVRFDLLKRHFKNRYSLPLALETDKSYSPEKIKNCRMLYRYLQKSISDEERAILRYIGNNPRTFGELKDAAFSLRSPAYSPFKLVAHNICKMDADNEILSEKSILEILK